jgi:hypothetical protein
MPRIRGAGSPAQGLGGLSPLTHAIPATLLAAVLAATYRLSPGRARMPRSASGLPGPYAGFSRRSPPNRSR